MKKYSVIVGQGRSGTNWLLDLFNLSETTYVRNEPHELNTSPISELNSFRVAVRSNQELLIKEWDLKIELVNNRASAIDPWIPKGKVYLKFNRLKYMLLRSIRCKKILSMFIEKFRVDEWDMPLSSVDNAIWKNAYRVFKFVQSPGWAEFLLKNKAHVHVFHIVREPGGFVNSWKNRYLSIEESKVVHNNNLLRLKDISTQDDKWREKFGDIDQLGLIESELWYWYYANEVIYQAGFGKKNYSLIIYEELAAKPLEKTKELYSAIGLNVTQKVESEIIKMSKNSKEISNSWRKNLTSEEVALCEGFHALAMKSFYLQSDGY